MSKLLDLTLDFYDAAWDFSTRLMLLPDQLTMDYDHLINPDTVINQYKKQIAPFMHLTGQDVTPKYFVMYDQIHSIMSEEVIPSLDILKEAWDELVSKPKNITQESKLRFAEKCHYIIEKIEMEIIAHTSGLRDELQAQPA